MQHRKLHDDGGQTTWVIVLETGDEVMQCMQRFAEEQGIFAAQFSAIGAFRRVVLNYFDWDAKQYIRIPVDQQVEVASLTGDIAQAPSGKPALHIHLVVGRRDGSAMAGHLGEGHVRPTLEIVLTESPTLLRKAYDPESGLALIRTDT
ncbi:DNA-binding protein [Rubrivivax sp. JA1024]|nr:DNA-binding protein [Rubrivivax sp. JA1024]